MKENIKGWLVNEDGEVRVNLDFSLNPKLFNKENYDVKFDKEYNVLNEQNFNKNEIALNKISILSLGTKLFLQTWEKAIREKKTIPNTNTDFLKLVYGMLNKVHISGNNKSLNELNYKGYINEGEVKFIYGYLVGSRYINESKNIMDIDIQNAFNEIKTFKIKPEIFNRALSYIHTKQYGNIAIVGFVYKNKYHKHELFNMALFNINKYGLFSESSYEIAFYDMLCDNKILFFKPYNRIKEYGGYIPDGIIEVENKKVFLEVFGMNTEDYHAKTKEKIEIMDSLNETHKLIKWEANKGEKMPTIQEILLEID